MPEYTPRAGSKAEAAITALQRHPWLNVADMALEMECEPPAVHSHLTTAIAHGAIRKVARDGRAGFSLGEPSTGDAPPQESAQKPRAAPAAAAPTGPCSAALAEDDSVLIIDGDRIVLRLTPQQARAVAALASRQAGR